MLKSEKEKQKKVVLFGNILTFILKMNKKPFVRFVKLLFQEVVRTQKPFQLQTLKNI